MPTEVGAPQGRRSALGTQAMGGRCGRGHLVIVKLLMLLIRRRVDHGRGGGGEDWRSARPSTRRSAEVKLPASSCTGVGGVGRG